ncbi:hypothetical protein [Sphingomonas mollis]|nr:hypothetical protein [Sphingomonas sp. BT553]
MTIARELKLMFAGFATSCAIILCVEQIAPDVSRMFALAGHFKATIIGG